VPELYDIIYPIYIVGPDSDPTEIKTITPFNYHFYLNATKDAKKHVHMLIFIGGVPESEECREKNHLFSNREVSSRNKTEGPG
jgi:hypothetical protein